MRVLVTGATGMLGPALIHHLTKNGHSVAAVSRNAPVFGQFGRGVRFIQADICDYASLLRAVRNSDVVFHLAAKLHFNNPSYELKSEYLQVNVQGTENVAKAAAECGVARLVHFSSINVYGPTRQTDLLTEASPLIPQSLYARTKAQSENVVWQVLAKHQRTSAVVLRLASVYGPRMQGNYKVLIRALKHRCFWPIGKGDNRRTLIYIDDLVRGALMAAAHPRAAGETFNLSDGHTPNFAEIIRAISSALERKPPRVHLPRRPVLGAASLGDKAIEVLGVGQPKLRYLLDKLLEDVAVSGDKIRRDLGFRPTVSLYQGWHNAVLQ